MKPVAEWQNKNAELFRTDGRNAVSLGIFYWGTSYMGQQPAAGNIQAWGELNPPGSIEAVFATASDGFWYADGRQPHIEKRRLSDGGITRKVEISTASGNLNADSLRITQRAWLAMQDPAWRRRIEAAVETIKPSPFLPRGAFQLMVDETGNVWYTGHDFHPRPFRIWYRLNQNGTTNFVKLPTNFRPFSVRNGIIAGVEQDVFDVEYVTLYRVGSTR